eukprot:gene4187-5165_t
MTGILPVAALWFALQGRALPENHSFFESMCYYYCYNPHELRPVCRNVLFLSTLYMVQNYAFVKALEFSSAGIDTAISQSASALVYLFSVFILNEEVLLAKVVAVALCVIGVTLFATANDSGGGEQSAHDKALGYGMALFSTTSTAVYRVCFKVLVGDKKLAATVVFA